MSPTLLVLAAGIGSRYGGLKQIDPIGPSGESIIDYSVFDAIRTGFDKVVFVIRHDIEAAFKESIGRKFDKRIRVEYTHQELHMIPKGFHVPSNRKKPWGTGHAIMVAENVINSPFAAINADDFYGHKGFQFLADYLKTIDVLSTDYAMVGFLLRNTLSEFGTVARGVCQCNEQDFLQSVIEITNIEKDGNGARYANDGGRTHTLSGDEIVSMNMWGFTPSLFGHMHQQFSQFLMDRGSNEKSEFYIPTAVHTLIKQDHARVKVLHSKDQWFQAKAKEKAPDSQQAKDQWFGLTYQNDKSYASKAIETLIRQGQYPARLWS